MSNNIELLISLNADSNQSKNNINQTIAGLKKYYDRNPLLINVDFNTSKAIGNLNNLINQLKSQKVELDVGFKGGKTSSELNSIKSQAKDLSREFEQLNSVMNSSGQSSTKAFNIDLDRVLIQLDNLGRKGAVAQTHIDSFRSSINALRDTNDRLSLKETVKDIFNITSQSNHADKVLMGLEKALIGVGQAQQKLTGLKDKFALNPATKDEYQSINKTINNLTNDIIKLQTQASNGGSDKIKLAEQMRDVTARLKEAKMELDRFNASSKTGTTFEKTAESARKLYAELQKTGSVSDGRLSAFANAINSIGNSTLSAQTKIMHLNRAMDSVKDHAKNVKFDEKFGDSVDRGVSSLNKLEAKMIRISQIHKNTYDKQVYDNLIAKLEQVRTKMTQVENPTQLRGLTREYRALAGQVDLLGARASTAARASQGLGDSLRTAFQKFPVWVTTAAIFYAPIRGIKDLTEQVLMLDTALTDMKRVMSLPDYKFNEILERSIENVGNLSGKMEDYLKLVSEFGRTGKNDEESLALADTATVLQNISDLNAEESVSALTSAQISFNIAAEDSILIANKLNEVDNNYSITTKDLTQSMMKAASTAATFGVSLDELLGYTTAIGAATRE